MDAHPRLPQDTVITDRGPSFGVPEVLLGNFHDTYNQWNWRGDTSVASVITALTNQVVLRQYRCGLDNEVDK